MSKVTVGSKFIGKHGQEVVFEMVFEENPDSPGKFGDAIYLINGLEAHVTDYKLALATLNTRGTLQ